MNQDQFPISIAECADIVDRIYQRYPFVDKPIIALIVKSFFVCLRERLVVGDIITINGLFSHMHIIEFVRKGYRNISVKLSTPEKIKWT